MRHCTTIALLFVVAVCGCGESTPDTLAESDYDEQEMDAAIARAQSAVDTFIAELSNPTGTDHAVKAPIADDGATEHFW
jgi:uncharacterized protein YegJ (DUF2314 family)